MANAQSDRDKKAEAAAKFALLETVALDDRCSPLMVRLVHVLASMTGSDGEAWPSYATLEFVTGAAKQNLQIAVERLFQIGYLVGIVKDTRAGNSKANRYRLATTLEPNPVWTLYRASEAYKHARQHAQPMMPPHARQHLKDARQRSFAAMLACPDPLNGPLGIEPGSDTTVSAAAGATASWKGSEGEPLPTGFPGEEAMRNARDQIEGITGLSMDLEAERKAFRSYHYSTRCLLTDWDKSWEMWIHDAIDRAEPA